MSDPAQPKPDFPNPGPIPPEEPPVREPEPDRLPDEVPNPNPDEQPNPPLHASLDPLMSREAFVPVIQTM